MQDGIPAGVEQVDEDDANDLWNEAGGEHETGEGGGVEERCPAEVLKRVSLFFHIGDEEEVGDETMTSQTVTAMPACAAVTPATSTK